MHLRIILTCVAAALALPACAADAGDSNLTDASKSYVEGRRRLHFAETNARDWAEAIINQAYLPEAAVQFVPCSRRDVADIDVLSASYSVDDSRVILSQSKHVMSIGILDAVNNDGAKEMSTQIEGIAKQILKGAEAGNVIHIAKKHQGFNMFRLEGVENHLISTVLWRADPDGSVWLLMLKKPSRTTQAAVSMRDTAEVPPK